MSYAKAYIICLTFLLIMFVYSLGAEQAFLLYKNKGLAAGSWITIIAKKIHTRFRSSIGRAPHL